MLLYQVQWADPEIQELLFLVKGRGLANKIKLRMTVWPNYLEARLCLETIWSFLEIVTVLTVESQNQIQQQLMGQRIGLSFASDFVLSGFNVSDLITGHLWFQYLPRTIRKMIFYGFFVYHSSVC